MNKLPLPILAWLFLVSVLIRPAWAAESLSASVDRTEISQGESLQLQVTGSMDVNFNFNIFNLSLPSPDLEPLKRDFDILEQRQRYSFQNINGQNQAAVTWTYTLMPKRAGTLTIPALKFKDAQSDPIQIEVTRQAPGTRTNEDLFLKAEVSKQQLYVQEQLIYTLRLYYQDNIISGDLTEPTLPNAVLRQIDQQKEYTQVVDGERYDVIERRYVVFPQTSGTLTIEPQMFTGTLYDSRLRDRRYAKATSDAVEVEVLPPPDDASGQVWLPAMGLSLTENWSRTPDNLDVGDSVTRTITIKALGLEGSQLPPLPNAEVAQLKQYPEQPQIDSETHPEGVTGTRIERTAMIAVQGGDVQLPEIRLPWWDTLNNRWQEAVIPARTIRVSGGSAPSAPPQPEPSAAQPDVAPPENNAAPQATATNEDRFWQAMSIALLIGWIATTLFFLLRRQRKSQIKASGDALDSVSDSEAQAFERLIALSGQDWNTVRPALLDWARAFWPHQTIYALADIANRAPSSGLGEIIQDLEAAHYSSHRSPQVGTDAVIAEVKRIRSEAKQKRKSETEGLVDLYPSAPR